MLRLHVKVAMRTAICTILGSKVYFCTHATFSVALTNCSKQDVNQLMIALTIRMHNRCFSMVSWEAFTLNKVDEWSITTNSAMALSSPTIP